MYCKLAVESTLRDRATKQDINLRREACSHQQSTECERYEPTTSCYIIVRTDHEKVSKATHLHIRVSRPPGMSIVQRYQPKPSDIPVADSDAIEHRG